MFTYGRPAPHAPLDYSTQWVNGAPEPRRGKRVSFRMIPTVHVPRRALVEDQVEAVPAPRGNGDPRHIALAQWEAQR